MRQIPALYSFNRGLVSPLGLARNDQKRIAMAARVMTNWMPRVLGAMALRPGTSYLGATLSNLAARYLPFIFATSDTALLEFTNGAMRVWINDALITRVSVASAVTNGTFDTNLTGWTQNDQAGATSAWVAGGYMGLTGSGTNFAIRDQTVTVAAGDQNKEHALHIVVQRGPVILRVGTSTTDDSYINETTLNTGTHSLAFTPTGNFNIRFKSALLRQTLVDSCVVESSGVMSITSPYLTADLGNIRFDQSADIVYLACSGYQQRQIERRGVHPGGRSWSLVSYLADDGPFKIQNVGPITLTPSALSGNITIASSDSLFRSSMVGGIFQLVSTGQNVTVSAVGQNQFTGPIRVTGVGTSRTFTIKIANTWTGTVTLQMSLDSSTGPWSDVSGKSWVANVTQTYADGLDNQIVWYQLGIKTGNYGSGQADCTLTIAIGSITGIARLTAYSSPTSVSAEVLTALGGTTATSNWSQGQWSDYGGWPTAVKFHEGRLWWSGKNGIWGSVSDAFNSFDASTIGDSAPINRTIGSGPVDTINWILSIQRMLVGAQGAEFSIRSSSLDEPLTPTNFNIKPASTQGSSAVEAQRIDQRGIYVDRSGIRVYELAFDLRTYEYNSTDITGICPELGLPGIIRMAVQRKPDTRIHCIRSDGTVMIGIYDPNEEVLAWVNYSTNGLVEDVVVLPGMNGSTEDQVYYVVNRTINGGVVRYLEKWATEIECRGGTLNKQADAFVIFTNSPASTTVTGLSHLIGQSVVVWQDGKCPADPTTNLPKTYTVSGGGTITLDTTATTGIVGLAYTGQFQSMKLGLQQSPLMTLLNQQKRLSHLGLILAYAHPYGLQFGPDFNNLNDLPQIEAGTTVAVDTVRTSYDEQEFEFPGVWVTDMRLCLQAYAPRPITVMAAVVDMEVHN